MRIFVLIPALNERENLPILINQIEKQFNRQKIQFKIYFVLQGEDGSQELLFKLKKSRPYLDFTHHKKPLGIGLAYQIGYSHIDKSSNYILTMDADLNHDIGELPKFLNAIKENKSDIVIGSRFVKEGAFEDKRIWKKIASWATNKIVSKLLNIPIKDISSGFRLIKKEVVEKIRPKLKYSGYPSYMEFILEAYKSDYKIKEVPITYHPRILGESKINSIKTVTDYIVFLKDVMLN